MDLKQFRCVLAVAEELSFGRAARRLNMLPTALGRQVRLLEEELGAPLFRRTTRQVALTPAGAALLPGARAALEQAGAAARAARAAGATPAAALRLGAIDSAAAGLLPRLLPLFRRRHPEVATRLVEAKSAQILPMLRAGRLDVGLVRPPPAGSGLRFEWLMQERPFAALPRAHPLARRRRLRPADLAGVPLILPPRRTRPHSFAMAVRLFTVQGLEPVVAQEAEEKQTIVNMVAAGIGVAILPEWVARMRAPGIAWLPLALPEGYDLGEWALGAAWVPGTPCPARDAFLETLRAAFPTGGAPPP